MFSAFGKGPTASGTGLFLTRDSATPNSTLSISYSPVPLAVGPLPNAENMESLLPIGGAGLVRDITTRYHFSTSLKRLQQ